jgi:hypothetical protein
MLLDYTACLFYRVPERDSFIAQKASIHQDILWQLQYSGNDNWNNLYCALRHHAAL